MQKKGKIDQGKKKRSNKVATRILLSIKNYTPGVFSVQRLSNNLFSSSRVSERLTEAQLQSGASLLEVKLKGRKAWTHKPHSGPVH